LLPTISILPTPFSARNSLPLAARMPSGPLTGLSILGCAGKPQPALIIQADVFDDIHSSITVVPLTSTIINAPLFRITLDPSRLNGLNRVSQIMVDKVLTMPREKIGKRVGHLGNTLMIRVGRALSVWLGMS